MPALCQANSIPQAALNPILHPWETAHTLCNKNNIKSASKVFGVVAAALKCLEAAFDAFPDISTLKRTCDAVNLSGKLCVDSENLVYSMFGENNNIFRPENGNKGPSDTTYINLPVYVVKISSLAIATFAQTWITVEKLFVPQLAAVSEAFVAHAGKIALSIGGTNLQTVAKCVTSVGLSNVKNVSAILFLSIDLYQCGRKAYANRNRNGGSIVKAIEHEFKSLENLSKIAVISLALFGAPLPLILGASLVTAYLAIVTDCQKSAPSPSEEDSPRTGELAPRPEEEEQRETAAA